MDLEILSVKIKDVEFFINVSYNHANILKYIEEHLPKLRTRTSKIQDTDIDYNYVTYVYFTKH